MRKTVKEYAEVTRNPEELSKMAFGVVGTVPLIVTIVCFVIALGTGIGAHFGSIPWLWGIAGVFMVVALVGILIVMTIRFIIRKSVRHVVKKGKEFYARVNEDPIDYNTDTRV